MTAEAHRLGFWGPRTASVDWCEPNYVWSHYVAEWWNTITSVSDRTRRAPTAHPK